MVCNPVHNTLAKFSGGHSAAPSLRAALHGRLSCMVQLLCSPPRVTACAPARRATALGRAGRRELWRAVVRRRAGAGRAGTMRLVFITGQGLHSASGRAVVRPALLAAVAWLGLECEASAGAVTVLLRPEAGR